MQRLVSRHLFHAQGRKKFFAYTKLRYPTKQSTPSLGGGWGEASSYLGRVTRKYWLSVCSFLMMSFIVLTISGYWALMSVSSWMSVARS